MYTCNTLADLTNQTATLTIPGPGSGQQSGYQYIQLKTGGNAVLTMPCCPNVDSLCFSLSFSFTCTLPSNDPGVIEFQAQTGPTLFSGYPILIGSTSQNKPYTYGGLGAQTTLIWSQSAQAMASITNNPAIGWGILAGTSEFGIQNLPGATNLANQESICFSTGMQLSNTTSTAIVTVKEFKLTLL